MNLVIERQKAGEPATIFIDEGNGTGDIIIKGIVKIRIMVSRTGKEIELEPWQLERYVRYVKDLSEMLDIAMDLKKLEGPF